MYNHFKFNNLHYRYRSISAATATAAANQLNVAAAIYGRDRQTDGQTDGRTDTRPLHDAYGMRAA